MKTKPKPPKSLSLVDYKKELLKDVENNGPKWTV